MDLDFVDRDVEIATLLCKIADRQMLRGTRRDPDRTVNPLIATQAAPGGGKSRFLYTVAQLKNEDLNLLLDPRFDNLGVSPLYRQTTRNLLENTVGITTSYNYRQSILSVLENRQNALPCFAIRILHSFVSSFFFPLFFDQHFKEKEKKVLHCPKGGWGYSEGLAFP